jgi:CDP-diacylglycerol pyrophosphatase
VPHARLLGSLVVALAVVVALVALALQRHAQRERLRLIVQEQCLPGWLATHQPAPCSSVTLLGTGPDAQGYAVLHDRKGGAHFLLIPTRTIGGIESPEARSADAPNYFDAAWKAREVLEPDAGAPLPRTAVGLAVNQLRARSQDQLHIHISCLRASTFDALRQHAAQIGLRWTRLELGGHSYYAMRVMGEELASANPIRLLAGGIPAAKGQLADYTLLVAGETFSEGPGFVLLAAQGVPGAELLLDASCAVAHGPTAGTALRVR